MTREDRISLWVTRLRSAAAQTLHRELGSDAAQLPHCLPPSGSELVEAFRDESGSRRLIDRLLLCWRLGVSVPDADARDAGRGAIDERLWLAVATGSKGPSGPEELVGLSEDVKGPMIAEGGAALEVWTERELAVLHAAWHLSARDGWTAAGITRPRLWRAVAWFVENIQPDNATNHPWGLHVFVATGIAPQSTGLDPGVATAADYCAQMMLHNCQVGLGRADVLSAHVLADAADALDAAAPH